LIFRGLFFEHNPREIGSAFHPDGIRTSKAFHWAGRAGAEIGQKTIYGRTRVKIF